MTRHRHVAEAPGTTAVCKGRGACWRAQVEFQVSALRENLLGVREEMKRTLKINCWTLGEQVYSSRGGGRGETKMTLTPKEYAAGWAKCSLQ